MPWTSLSTQSWAVGDDGIYRGATFPKDTVPLAWGLDVNIASSGTLPRRRIGFLVWYFVADGRDLCYPTVEVFSGVEGRPLARHLFFDSDLNTVSGLTNRVTSQGYAFAPDRGCFPCTTELFKLTP